MARIAVISCNDRCCLGARQLSALVRPRHVFNLVCYGEYDHTTFRDTARVGDEPDERLLLDLLGRLSPDLVGFSYRSAQAGLVAHLAGRVRAELGLPIIMGGIGATSDPDEALCHGDFVCVGEGDFALPRLLDEIERTGSPAEAARHTPNLCRRTDSGTEGNSLERLVSREELSSFPYIDYDEDGKFSIVRGELIENDGRFDNDVGAYPMLTSRGCPFACTYCHNSNVHDLYRHQRYCRQRSVESVIAELEQARERRPIRMVSIYDDLFTLNREWALEFAAQYRKRIALPFWCYTHPSRVTREVHAALVDAGLDNTAMGVQSGSERTLFRVFNRRTTRSRILEAAAVLKELHCRVQIDLITANPFEDDDDRRDTLDLMQRMPKITRGEDHDRAWYYCQSRLTYFPKSRISLMVSESGVNTEFDPDVASFWEMLHELAFSDEVPQSAVMYLSYIFEEYRQSAGSFDPETAARWIADHLLERPLTELAEIADAAGGDPDPTLEELTSTEVRALMDGVGAARRGGTDARDREKAEAARELLRSLTPERRALQLKRESRVRARLTAGLIRDIRDRARKQQELQEELGRRGAWALELDRTVRDRDAVIRQLQAELEDRTRWALELDRTVAERDNQIRELQSAAGRLPKEAGGDAADKGTPIQRLFRRS